MNQNLGPTQNFSIGGSLSFGGGAAPSGTITGGVGSCTTCGVTNAVASNLPLLIIGLAVVVLVLR